MISLLQVKTTRVQLEMTTGDRLSELNVFKPRHAVIELNIFASSNLRLLKRHRASRVKNLRVMNFSISAATSHMYRTILDKKGNMERANLVRDFKICAFLSFLIFLAFLRIYFNKRVHYDEKKSFNITFLQIHLQFKKVHSGQNINA